MGGSRAGAQNCNHEPSGQSGLSPTLPGMTVNHAVGLPTVGEFGDPRVLLELAVAAERYGWDGVYLWDHVLYHDPQWSVANPVVALSAIAAHTSRVRLGVLVTALPRPPGATPGPGNATPG